MQKDEYAEKNFSEKSEPLTTVNVVKPTSKSLLGHGAPVIVLVALADGKLASGSMDKTIKIWDPIKGECLRTLSGHIDAVTALAPLIGNRLASGSSDKTIKVWDTDTGQCVQTLSGFFVGHGGRVLSLVALPGDLLLSSGKDNSIKFWNLKTGKCLQTLSHFPPLFGGRSDPVMLTLLKGNKFASIAHNEFVSIWDINTKQCVKEFSENITNCTLLADGTLVTASRSGVSFFDAQSQERKPRSILESASSLVALPDGRLATGYNTIKLWNPCNGRFLQAASDFSKTPIIALTALPNNTLASNWEGNAIRLWKFPQKTIELDNQEKKHLPLIQSLMPSQTSIIKDPILPLNSKIFIPEQRVSAFALLPNNVLATGGIDIKRAITTIIFWDLKSGKNLGILIHGIGGSYNSVSAIRELIVLPDNLLVSVCYHGYIKLWNLQKGKCVGTKGFGNLYGVTVLPNGILAIATHKSEKYSGDCYFIEFWDTQNEEFLKPFNLGHRVSDLIATGDGIFIISNEYNGIFIWDYKTGQCLQTLYGHAGNITRLELLPDDTLASISSDKTVKLWNINTGQCLQTLQGHTGSITAFLQLPNGTLVTGSTDKTIKFWNVNSGQCLQSITLDKGQHVSALASLPDGTLLMSLNRTPDDSYLFIKKNEEEEIHESSIMFWIYSEKSLINQWESNNKQEETVKEMPEKLPKSIQVPPGKSKSIPIASKPVGKLMNTIGDIQISVNIHWKDLGLGTVLGEGTFSVVYKGSYQDSEVAIKKLKNQTLNQTALNELKTEVSAMKNVDSPRVVRCFGACLEEDHFALVMEYMPEGSLYHFLDDSNKELSWPLCYQLCIDISAGMAFLHSKPIVHGDLKSLNVLLERQLDGRYRAKIADFGQAKIRVGNTTLGARAGGSLNYLAPELLRKLQVLDNGQVTFKDDAETTVYSDIYSYGMVIWELTMRRVPFAEEVKQPLKTFQKLVCEDEVRETHNPDTTSTNLQYVINCCWHNDSKRRLPIGNSLELIKTEAKGFGYID
jgi:WD40 repeat protein/tRNA A-37 threonylcarbamoyl transferase component Bud32